MSNIDPIQKTRTLLGKGVDIDYMATKVTYDHDLIQAYNLLRDTYGGCGMVQYFIVRLVGGK